MRFLTGGHNFKPLQHSDYVTNYACISRQNQGVGGQGDRGVGTSGRPNYRRGGTCVLIALEGLTHLHVFFLQVSICSVIIHCHSVRFFRTTLHREWSTWMFWTLVDGPEPDRSIPDTPSACPVALFEAGGRFWTMFVVSASNDSYKNTGASSHGFTLVCFWY